LTENRWLVLGLVDSRAHFWMGEENYLIMLQSKKHNMQV
jgi:hypothetical protein